MPKTTLITRDLLSWKTAGAHIAFLDKRANLHLMHAADNAKPERIDDNVKEFQLTNDLLVYETTDGSLHVLPLR